MGVADYCHDRTLYLLQWILKQAPPAYIKNDFQRLPDMRPAPVGRWEDEASQSILSSRIAYFYRMYKPFNQHIIPPTDDGSVYTRLTIFTCHRSA